MSGSEGAGGRAAYPPPPWQTTGDAVLIPFSVGRGLLRPPAGFALAGGGRALGLLGFVEYRAPSPLVYRELFWMPARVRDRESGAEGWWVAKMLVDHPASLAAGRALWALPKELARFEVSPSRWRVEADDGARITLEASSGVPLPRARTSVLTLQRDGAGLVRFRGDFEGAARLTRARIRWGALDGTWQGLLGARRLGPLALRLADFRAVMRAPRRG